MGRGRGWATTVTVTGLALAALGAAPAEDRRTWVALGDSYAAGVLPEAGEPVAGAPPACERRAGAYPAVLGTGANVACRDAAIRHLVSEPQGEGVPPQLDAVAEGTDVVTVTAGAADLGLADIFARCRELGAAADGAGTPCRDALAPGLPDHLAAVADGYDELLDALGKRVPKATVVVTGYPPLVPDDVAGCAWGDEREFGTITAGDLDWLRAEVLAGLDHVIWDQTEDRGGYAFVDLAAAGAGRSVCDRENDARWAEGVAGGHLLNARGHAAVADLVARAALDPTTGNG